MKIKNLDIKNNILLAPMAGYTDVGFRRLCAKSGAGITYTEMVSAKALAYDSEKTKDLLFTDENETIKAVQLFGNEIDYMAKACENPLLQKFDLIDINMGCPAPKIIKNHEGSYLLTNPRLAGDIVRACVDATNKPITVKMRLGYANENVSLQFAKELEKSGASLITVHGRTQSQMYSGKVNYEAIKQIKQEVNIPVVCNGDIVDLSSLQLAKQITLADGYMIGRGALGNPTIFEKLLEAQMQHNTPKLQLILEHIETLKNYFSEKFITLNMRKHIAFYLKNTGANSQLKQALMMEENLNNVIEILKNFFKNKE